MQSTKRGTPWSKNDAHQLHAGIETRLTVDLAIFRLNAKWLLLLLFVLLAKGCGSTD